MAKDKLTEYSATNASNDVIGDISVAEGMLPSAVNNALREQMTHLKNFSDGTDAIDALAVDNLKLDGNTISSTDTNGNVNIDPAGTGETVIDSSVRITKTSGAPTLLLTDNDTSGDGTIDASDGNLRFYSDNDGEVAGSLMGFYVDGSEAMRLDAARNLLVGTTDTVPSDNGAGGDAGVAISPDGVFRAARSGNVSLDINRMDSDGEIATFRKNGTTTGTIVTDAGDLTIGTGVCGLRFLDGSNAIIPRNTARSTSNGALDLGSSSTRFKDIYLSGGAQIGNGQNISWGGSYSSGYPTVYATSSSGGYIVFAPNGNAPSTNQVRIVNDGIEFGAASSNLNDYEEGTWTPTVGGTATYSVQEGHYTKIGDLVHARCSIVINAIGSGATTNISGLPFTCKSGTNGMGQINVGFWSNFKTNTIALGGFVASGTTTVFFTGSDASASSVDYPFDFIQNGTRIDYDLTYRV
jgi:hypothetical protein